MSVTRTLPNTLRISIAQKPVHAIFIARGASYALQSDGSIAGMAPQDTKGALIIYDTGGSLPVEGARVIRPELMSFLNTFSARKGFTGYAIAYALAPDITHGNGITIATNKGFRILIDPTQDVDAQLARMNKIVAQIITPQKVAQIDYIDLRFNDRVFYRTR